MRIKLSNKEKMNIIKYFVLPILLINLFSYQSSFAGDSINSDENPVCIAASEPYTEGEILVDNYQSRSISQRCTIRDGKPYWELVSIDLKSSPSVASDEIKTDDIITLSALSLPDRTLKTGEIVNISIEELEINFLDGITNTYQLHFATKFCDEQYISTSFESFQKGDEVTIVEQLKLNNSITDVIRGAIKLHSDMDTIMKCE